jgi:hypothetical protein
MTAWASLVWCARASEPPADGDVLVVEADRKNGAASERSLDHDAIEATPGRSTDDLLSAMPGLHQSAHGGHGKAYQYFLRGFDAVHGADIAVDLEGVPLNELSNVHAHGYLDLHFIPLALVEGVDLHPGAWQADAGDFAIAGSASFTLGLQEPGVTLGGGTDTSGVATIAWRPAAASTGTFLVGDVDVGRGVGDARDWRQARVGVGVAGDVGGAQARAWALVYDGVFASPGVLREDDLLAGEVGFYDAYPGSGGGRSTRALGAASISGGGARATGRLSVWAGYRALALEQNFTGWYDDEVHGDGTVQRHQAGTFGVDTRGWWRPGSRLAAEAGATARVEPIHQEEAAIDTTGDVWEERATLTAVQTEVGAWLATPMRVTPWIDVTPAVRGEVFLVDVDGAATAWAPVVAPKLAVVLFRGSRLTWFANYGRGYRSPDARGAGDGGRAPVALADGVELGATATPVDRLALRAAGFATFVTDEIVFDHVEARYLATGTTRRVGFDGGIVVRPRDALRIDADITWTDGRYAATGEPIPYAPRLLVVVGTYAEALPIGPHALTAGLRGVVLGRRPLPGGFSSHPSVTADLTTTLSVGRWAVGLEVDNALGARWRDGEFMFPSRWDPTEPAAELPVRHFTAGTPTAARVSLTRRF